MNKRAAAATGVAASSAMKPRAGNASPLWFALFAAAFVSTGCSTAPPREALLAGVQPPRAVAQAVTIFFATDRAPGERGDPAQAFGAERGTTAYGAAHMILDQPVPASANASDPTSPTRPSRRAVRDILVETEQHDTRSWLAALEEASQSAPERAVLVYVHGFDTSFGEAVQDAARLKTGLGFEGPVVAFSWPSRASVSAYIADETNARWAIPHLESVLRLVGSQSRIGPVHLLAHSMGSRLLLPALTRLHAAEQRRRWPFGEIVLLAPDLDREIFVRDMLPELSGVRSRISVYISAQDPAMVASEAVNIYPRLGDARRGPTIAPGVETIDITPVARLSSAHAYFREHPAVLGDLAELVIERRDADHRSRLNRRQTSDGAFWELASARGGN